MDFNRALRVHDCNLTTESVAVDRARHSLDGDRSAMRVDTDSGHTRGVNLGVAPLYIHSCFARCVEFKITKGKTTFTRSRLTIHSQAEFFGRRRITVGGGLKFDLHAVTHASVNLDSIPTMDGDIAATYADL